MALSPSSLPTPLPGCLLACCDLSPEPLPCDSCPSFCVAVLPLLRIGLIRRALLAILRILLLAFLLLALSLLRILIAGLLLRGGWILRLRLHLRKQILGEILHLAQQAAALAGAIAVLFAVRLLLLVALAFALRSWPLLSAVLLIVIVGLLVLPLAILILVALLCLPAWSLASPVLSALCESPWSDGIVGILLILSLLALILVGGIVGVGVVFPGRSMAPILRHLLLVRRRELILNHARHGR